jgi:pyrophosphatase PpaX
MKYKGIIFDFDGTIADTLPLCFYSFKEIFKEYDQRDLSSEEIIQMFGPSEVGIIQQNMTDSNQIEKAIQEYYYHYDKEHENYVRFDNNMSILLNELIQAGYSLGIYTGKARRSFEISMRRLGLDQFFNVTITGDDVEKPKPDPEGVITALTRMKLGNREVLFVGDSNADIEAGNKAAVNTIAVSWFPGSHNNFIQVPTHYCNNINDFMKLID